MTIRKYAQILMFASCVVPLTVACSDNVTTTPGPTGTGGSSSGTGGSDSGGSDSGGATAGKITVESTELSGYEGKIVLAFISKGGGLLGGICDQLDSDPDTARGVVSEIGDHPCDLAEEIVFEPGEYIVTAGLYTAGERVPDECMDAVLTVDGDTLVTLPPPGTCD